MIRKPIVAGTFYSDKLDELDDSIKNSFNAKFGPGTLPSDKKEKKILGAIVPHAGYFYSGSCAAWAYKEIAETDFPDVYIILGNDHVGFGQDCVSTEDWENSFRNS